MKLYETIPLLKKGDKFAYNAITYVVKQVKIDNAISFYLCQSIHSDFFMYVEYSIDHVESMMAKFPTSVYRVYDEAV